MRGKRDHSRERKLRSAQTDAESKLWHHLRDRRLQGFKFRRQHRIGPYIVDLVCDAARLIIEVDGGQHGDRVDQDEIRTKALEARGYQVIRFWNDDTLLRTDEVLTAILRALEARQPRRI